LYTHYSLLRSFSTPPFLFSFTLPFWSCDLLSPDLSPDQSPDFYHMTVLLFLLFHCSQPLSALLGDAYCSTFYCFPFSIVPPYCLDPYCSLGSIVRLLRTLSQVAASVVYKLACIVERGLKPDLVFQSKCCCSSKLFVCLSPSLSLSHLPLGHLKSPLRLSLYLPLL